MAAAPQEQIIQKPARSPFEATLLAVSCVLLGFSSYLMSIQLGYFLRPTDTTTLQSGENISEVEFRKVSKQLDELETMRMAAQAAKPQ